MEAEIVIEVNEKAETCGTKNNIPHAQQSKIVTEIPSKSNQSQITAKELDDKTKDGAQRNVNDNSNPTMENLKLGNVKNKRKRRRGKPKVNVKPYKKSNWKFQIPRYRNRGNSARDKLLPGRCIVPYNTNRFLMEEHMAEVPSALLTPSGRTRESSFSVDSEDNYFYSLPEDEEEFLTKEFAHVYERARVERLENMSKQQLIEECLQLEDRYMQTSELQQQSNNVHLMNKIKYLEDRVRELNAENIDLRRQLDYAQKKLSQEDRMCSSSEDSESDSTSSSSSSSCESSEYSQPSSIATNELDNSADINSQMESDDVMEMANQDIQESNQNQLENGNEIICNGHAEASSSNSVRVSPMSSVMQLSSQQGVEDLHE